MEENALVVRNAYKRYGPKAVVLKGLNMTVKEGSVYGFLGPSGCGKTTLLGCVVGRRTLDAGEIILNVKKRSHIGYMPQELALLKELSIAETITYYASLYGLTGDKLKKRKEELFAFLELPNENSVIDKISGGQQRRVSLCIALLHDPKVLVLDEPTVGLDPVLSQSIWKYLLTMSTVYNKTIVITTHYIEEAKQAHKIGLMRGGVILDEDEPNQLMVKHNCSTLEQAFLLLSQKQSNGNNNYLEEECKDFPKPAVKPIPPLAKSKSISFRHILSHLYKSWYWLRRNKPIVLFLLMLPIVQCILFDMTVGRDPLGLKMGYVNYEISNGRSECYSNLNETCSLNYPVSCKFLEVLEKKKMVLVEYNDAESARTGVMKNEIWGYFQFSNNYTESLVERIALINSASDEALENSEVNVWMDMSNQYIGNLIRRDLYYGYLEFLEGFFETCGWPVNAAKIPIGYKPAVFGDNNPSFAEFAVPAILQLFEFYLPMMFTVGAILMEKREGVLERSLISGMTLPETMIGHSIVQFIVLAIQTLFMMIVLFVVFDNTIKGSLGLALTLLFLVGVSGMCYGYLVSSLCDSDQAATYMGLGSFFPLAMLSGMVWPFEGMHYLLRAVGTFLPLTLTTEAFRAISTRAWPLSHPVVYSGFISTLGWSLFFCIGTYGVIKIKKGIRGR